MYRAYVAIAVLLTTASVGAQQNALTEEMAIQIGLSREPITQRLEGTIARAQSDVIAANTWPNPELHYERETLDNAADSLNQKLVLSQRFDFSGRRGLQQQAADQHLNAARYQSAAWQAERVRTIRQAFYHALFQQARRQLYQATQQRISLLGDALHKRRREGDVSIYDYQRVVTARAAIDAEVRNVEVDYAAGMQALWARLGTDAQPYQALQGELAPGSIAPLEQLLTNLEQQPALQQLKAQSEGFALQQRAASRSFPEVTLGLGMQQEEANGVKEDGLILNATIPLALFDRRKDSQARYQAEAMLAGSEYQLALDTARAELNGLWLQVMQYQRSAQTFRDEAIQGTQDLIRIAETYYRAGEIGILELLDAYRGALNAELNVLDLELKARDARIKLDYLSGGSIQ